MRSHRRLRVTSLAGGVLDLLQTAHYIVGDAVAQCVVGFQATSHKLHTEAAVAWPTWYKARSATLDPRVYSELGRKLYGCCETGVDKLMFGRQNWIIRHNQMQSW